MLEISPEWNEVSDLMMEEEEVLPATKAAVNWKIDEVARGLRKGRKEDDICPEKHEHSPTESRRQGIQRDSILKIGMKLNRKKMNGRRKINGKGFHRWYFVAHA